MDRICKVELYVPSVVRDTTEMALAYETEDEELTNYWSNVSSVPDEQYVESMSENAVARFEKMLGIVPYNSESIEDRKFHLSTVISTDLPYTMRSLINTLNTIVGNDYTLESSGYVMTVKVGLGSKRQFEQVEDMLRKVIPANILLTVTLLYNTYSMIGEYNHNQLSSLTHEELRSSIL